MPDSEFKDKKEEKEVSPFTKAILVLTDDDATQFKVVEKFEHDGIEYSHNDLGFAYATIIALAKDMESRQQAMAVAQQLINAPIGIQNAAGQIQNFPFMVALAKMVVGELQAQSAQIQRANKEASKIILPH